MTASRGALPFDSRSKEIMENPTSRARRSDQFEISGWHRRISGRRVV